MVGNPNVYRKISELNRRNNLLLAKYENDKKYARVHKRITEKRMPIAEMKVCEALQDVKAQIDKNVLNNSSVMKNKGFFKRMMGRIISLVFEDKKIAINTEATDFIQNVIFNEYTGEYNGEMA